MIPVYNALFHIATTAGDKFRSWLYPDGQNTRNLDNEILPLLSKGYSAQQIAWELYKQHA